MSAPLSRTARLAAYDSASTALSRLDDRQLTRLLAGAVPAAQGGGRAARLKVGTVPVLVRRIPLTDRELLAGNVMSTADLFRLPPACHYGVRSPGFGAWRELAVHGTTTDWVLLGESQDFPLMYHWRVLPSPGVPVPEELADVDKVVGHWEGSPEVRARVEELGRASYSAVLFLEYIPLTLRAWLAGRTAEGGGSASSAWAAADRGLRSGTAYMNSRGLLHFDTRLENVLTDGHRLYFTGFGHALHERFTHAPQEARFFRDHRDYDSGATASHLAHWLVSALSGHRPDKGDALLRHCARGGEPDGLPGTAAELVTRYAPVATVMADFQGRLHAGDPAAVFPAREVREALAG
ncbi:protein kinase family protein [Kitasatospora sp. NPDC088346]|uniref:protein kinase family protein n=1 Tax=Kitasatospora sp. NPDC088346 TaxID=3364073 RepID=UPI00380E6553